ncbi:hypothetical protein O1611_g4374 [Lasiodiplodia mahajangana]|uniref:Uncharacterized protein n=1 Tax=Lasiodiplodia mahajangana TaxID=1108764 RepID=A0ACC2JP33_9PEZI|nr:hypothetical protein O1611_g4374 [Lasiodiplodia mahajangana]
MAKQGTINGKVILLADLPSTPNARFTKSLLLKGKGPIITGQKRQLAALSTGLGGLGITRDDVSVNQDRIRLRATDEALRRIAEIDEIGSIEEVTAMTIFNNIAGSDLEIPDGDEV